MGLPPSLLDGCQILGMDLVSGDSWPLSRDAEEWVDSGRRGDVVPPPPPWCGVSWDPVRQSTAWWCGWWAPFPSAEPARFSMGLEEEDDGEGEEGETAAASAAAELAATAEGGETPPPSDAGATAEEGTGVLLAATPLTGESLAAAAPPFSLSFLLEDDRRTRRRASRSLSLRRRRSPELLLLAAPAESRGEGEEKRGVAALISQTGRGGRGCLRPEDDDEGGLLAEAGRADEDGVIVLEAEDESSETGLSGRHLTVTRPVGSERNHSERCFMRSVCFWWT